MSASAGIVPVRRFLFSCKVYVCRFILRKRGRHDEEKFCKGNGRCAGGSCVNRCFSGCGGNKKDNGAAGKTADASSVKIGFITAYTGPGAAYGVAMKEGVDLAVEEINNNPKTKVKIDLKTYDTKLVKAEAINAMKKRSSRIRFLP